MVLPLEMFPVISAPEMLSASVVASINALPHAVAAQISVAAIDPGLSDTAAFCEAYGQDPDDAANCIVVAGKRGDVTTYAACVVLAATRLDVNGVVRKLLDARKASFAPMDEAVSLTGMEYGGITPIGLPADWRVLVDERVLGVDLATVGAGLRAAKLFFPGSLFVSLPQVEIVKDLARSI